MSLPGNWTITKMVAFWIVMRKPRLQKGAVPWSCWWQVTILEVKPIYHALGFYFSCKTQHFMIIIIKTKSQPSALPEDRCGVFFRVVAAYQVPLCMSTHVWKQDDRNGHPCLKPRWPEWAPKPCLSRLWSLSMEVWLHLHSGPREKCTVLKGSNPFCLIYRNWT